MSFGTLLKSLTEPFLRSLIFTPGRRHISHTNLLGWHVTVSSPLSRLSLVACLFIFTVVAVIVFSCTWASLFFTVVPGTSGGHSPASGSNFSTAGRGWRQLLCSRTTEVLVTGTVHWLTFLFSLASCVMLSSPLHVKA